MMKVKEYKILKARNHTELDNIVEDNICDGWQKDVMPKYTEAGVLCQRLYRLKEISNV